MKYDDFLKQEQTSKPRRRPRHLEDELQIACVQWFDMQYHDISRYLHHSPNGGKRSKVEAAIFKAMGVRAGFPDLLLFYPGKFYHMMGIELKAGKGRQSEAQKEYQELFERIGAKYAVVRSLDEFIKIVKNYFADL